MRRAAVALRQDRVQEPSPLARRADQQEHLLGPEEDGARGLGDGRGAPCQPVELQPLAHLGRGVHAGEQQLDPRRLVAPGVGQVQADASERPAVAHQLVVGGGAGGAPGDRHVDRLEQVGLAGAVRPGHDGEPRLEQQLSRGVRAEVLEGQPGQAHIGPCPRQEAVRTGMMTWT